MQQHVHSCTWHELPSTSAALLLQGQPILSCGVANPHKCHKMAMAEGALGHQSWTYILCCARS